MTCLGCFLQLSNNGRQWPNANWVIPWELFWVVMFTGYKVRRSATGWGALGVQSEPQGLWSLEPLLRDVVSFSQAQEACENRLHFLVWLLKRLIAKHYVFSAGKKGRKSNCHYTEAHPLFIHPWTFLYIALSWMRALGRCGGVSHLVLKELIV